MNEYKLYRRISKLIYSISTTITGGKIKDRFENKSIMDIIKSESNILGVIIHNKSQTIIRIQDDNGTEVSIMETLRIHSTETDSYKFIKDIEHESALEKDNLIVVSGEPDRVSSVEYYEGIGNILILNQYHLAEVVDEVLEVDMLNSQNEIRDYLESGEVTYDKKRTHRNSIRYSNITKRENSDEV